MVTREALQAIAKIFAQNVKELQNRVVPGPFQKEKASLIDAAKKIAGTIQSIFGTMDEFEEAGLGFWPYAVGIVGIAGAYAAINAWNKRFYEFEGKVEEVDKLERSGIDRSKAFELVFNTKGNGGFFSGIGTNLVTLAVVLGGGYWLVKEANK